MGNNLYKKKPQAIFLSPIPTFYPQYRSKESKTDQFHKMDQVRKHCGANAEFTAITIQSTTDKAPHGLLIGSMWVRESRNIRL